MAPQNPKVTAAFEAMKVLGIPQKKVKPVLKDLLQTYEKNWGMIEQENYRVLVDAIFEAEDNVTEKKKKLAKNVDVRIQLLSSFFIVFFVPFVTKYGCISSISFWLEPTGNHGTRT